MKKYCCFLLFSLAVLPIIGQTTSNFWDSKETASISKEIQFQRLMDSSDVYYTKGDYRKDLALNFELLKLAFEINEPYYLHKGYRNLAYDYLVLGDTISAKESFEKSEKQAHLSMNDTVSAHIYMDLANVYSFTENNSEKAMEYHEKSIELFEKLNDSAGLAKAHYNTILTALETDDFNRAYVHIIKAKKYIEYGDTSYATALECLLGQYYHFKGKYEMANTYLLSTIALSRNNNDLVLLEDAYYYYSENLLKQEKFKEAYNARVKYEEYLETNQQKIISNEVEAASMNYQVAEFRKDVEIAENENLLQAEIVRTKSRLNTILIFIAACFILLFFTLFLAYRNRKKLVRELKIKNKEYLLAKEESEKFTKAKSKFFSTVSHELRTPLYGVIGLSSILLEDKSLKKHEQELKSLKFSADYLLALINDVLQINKLDANNLEDDQSAFNLRDLTRKISSSFEYMRLQNKNRIHLHISESIPQYIRGNSIRLSQILMNLIGNACKFTEEGDIYLIAENVDVEDGKLGIKFYVKDTGIGIPKEKQECIFDEFSQVNSTNYTYQGTGLGLPIVQKQLKQTN
jgi:signal transduction histidine kinase